ncbi:GTPase-associated protein 1-related protein [Lentzea sp. NPDC003310]|uniref:GAP1-N2 domain-containing protein n=1 Tax=Lentzea sp. NPDC003310 TaxID=3154447 RepID=UPI0033B661D3
MSAGFSSLLYTDCLPGQGLRGGAGFQFQAVSEGVGHEEMALVQRSSLYEAPAAWMRERRPAGEYPPSLTHSVDGVFATARGIYLGAEVNGAREGNQFTHAVTTTDPDAYGEVRPAQLWDAPWWIEKPAGSTRCESLPAVPEPGPWGRDAVREWVLGKPDGEEWLTAVFSALDRLGGPDGKRIAFVATDAVDVLGWLAAGTLLLPQHRALRVSFRVFATNPQYSRHDVIALHPDWAGSHADVRRGDEFVVFNLATGEHAEVEPTEAALHWVPRFLRDDPYDVVDAVELAAGSAATRGEPEVAGDRVASCVVTLGEEVRDPAAGAALARWLAVQPLDSVEDYREELVRAALGAARDADSLRLLDGAAHRHGVAPALAAEIRQALFAAEVAAVLAGAAEPVPPPHQAVRPTPGMTADLARAADQVRPEAMNSLLVLAAEFGVRPDAAAFRDGAHRFVRWWADHPAAAVDVRRWPNSEQMLHLVRDELGTRPVRADVGAAWWSLLWQTIDDPSAPLDAALASAAVARGSAQTRSAVISQVLQRAADDFTAWRALFGVAAPTTDEVLRFLESRPRTSEEVATAAFAALGALGRPELDVLAVLADRHHLPSQSSWRRLVQDDALLRRWLDDPVTRTANDLAKVQETPLTARAGQVLHVLLEKARPQDAAVAVRGAGRAMIVLLSRELPNRWTPWNALAPRAVALTYLTAMSSHCPERQLEELEDKLARFAASTTAERLAEVSAVAGLMSASEAKEWTAFASAARKQQAEARKRTPKPVSRKKTPASRGGLWPFGRKGEE